MTTKPGPKVLITDANSRRSLAVARSLGRRGIRVIAGNDKPYGLTYASKYCAGRMTYPHPQKHPAECATVLLDNLRRGRYDHFFPMSDDVVRLVANRFEEFSSAAPLLLPDPRSLKTALNKGETIRFAAARGFSHPRTFFVEDLGDLRRLKHEIPYPAVIKPRRGSGAEGIVFVKKPEHLTGQYLRIHRRYSYPLIQEMIPHRSPKYGVHCLFNRLGELRAAVVHWFSRQYPTRGGPGSCFETVDRPDILEQGVQLLQELGWKGVAQVEFLEDIRDGALKLMEINSRFWDSLQTAIQAGVDMPYMLFRAGTEGDVEPRLEYRTGEVCRSILPGEILYFLANFGRWQTRPSFWKFRGDGVGDCILSRDDPLPALSFPGIALRSLSDRNLRDSVLHRY